jgi:hypothetical protein
MNKINLFLLAIGIATLFSLWSWTQYQSASELKEQAIDKRARCIKLIAELEQLKARTAGKVVIAPEGYDSSASAAAAVKAAGLYDGRFSTSESSLGFAKGTNVKRWRVTLPGFKTSLRRCVSLVASLADSEMKLQVGQIDLKRPSSPANETSKNTAEVWETSFRKVTYLKASSDKR